MPFARSWRQWIAGATILAAPACGKEPVASLEPSEFVGHYQLTSVDGHPVGWYHQLAGVDCRAAFTTGRLTIAPDGYFQLHLPYNFRCLGDTPFDGEDVLGIIGSQIRPTEDMIVLNGYGPGLIAPGADTWSIEIRPHTSSGYVELRFWGLAKEYWADPVLVMGPKETYDPACVTNPCP